MINKISNLLKRKPKPRKDIQLLYFCQTTHHVPRAPISLFVCTDQQQSLPNFQMAKYLVLLCTKCKAKKKKSATEVYCVVVLLLVLLLMCWRDVRAEQQSCTKSFICAGKCVRESERQTAGSRGPRATLWALMSSYPFMLLFTLHPSLAPSLSHTALFPFDHILAKTCRAIYRRVVLFYLPVSICGTQKYRGLPGC